MVEVMQIRITFILVGCFVANLLPQDARAGLPQPKVKWSVKLDPAISGSPIAYPSARPDGIVLADGGQVVRLDGHGRVVFQKSFGPAAGRGGIFEPATADLDGDGKEELIVGHKAGIVCAMTADTGRILWQYDLGGPLDSWEMATAADLDGDRRPEILAATNDGWVVCLNHRGRLRWRSRLDSCQVSTPSVGDINNDGRPEIVYGTATRHLIALDATGRMVWDTFQPPYYLGRTMPLLADLDGDGKAEVYSLSSMIGNGTGAVSLNGADGSLRWLAPTYQKAYAGRAILPFRDGTRGVLVCDKGNNLCAYQADGRQRWHTRIEGRGIWTAPVIADLDGDGFPEIVTSVRGGGWSMLSNEGKLLGTYDAQGNHFGGSLVADIDGDGLLEVVNVANNGTVTAYTFGGPARPGAIISGDWRGPAYPLRAKVSRPKTATEPPATIFAEKLPDLRYGDNAFRAHFGRCPGHAVVEVATAPPDGAREIRGVRVGPGATAAEVTVPVTVAGRYEISIRLLDLDHHIVLGQQRLSQEVSDPTAGYQAISRAAEKFLHEIIERSARSKSAGHSQQWIVSLARLNAELQAECDLLGERIHAAGKLTVAARDALAGDSAAFLTRVQRARSLAALIEKEVNAGRTPGFVLWQDANPWDNRNPLDELPHDARPAVIHTWAFGNEIESVCVNAINLSAEPLTLRVEPGTLSRQRQKLTSPALADVAKLRRVVWLPGAHGQDVPDLLPKLAQGGLIDIAPGQVQQIWINLGTAKLEPGRYLLSWPVRSLDAAPTVRNLTIELEVSSVALPAKSRFLAGFWSSNTINGIDAVPDLNEHLQTLWYAVPLPAARADVAGNLVGAIDWSQHDAIIGRARQVMKILYGSQPPVPTFPAGVTVTEELRRTAQRNYFNALLEHLKRFGLDHTNVMFYVEDETGLTGSDANFLRGARRNKAVDPRVQNYADPCEGINVKMIREMEPLTDVWQPGMDNLEFSDPALVPAMRGATHKPIACYTPPGDCRNVRPLGFYRAQPWLAWHWGIEGGGWWVYYCDDLWGTAPGRRPSYGGVACDGRSLVDSRRWEAMRDGIEDFNAMALLQDWAEAKHDQQAKAVIREAVAYVAGRTLTGTPREATDYDLDYATFMRHRVRIRQALERLQRAGTKPATH